MIMIIGKQMTIILIIILTVIGIIGSIKSIKTELYKNDDIDEIRKKTIMKHFYKVIPCLFISLSIILIISVNILYIPFK